MASTTSVWSLYRTAEDRFDADIDCIDDPSVSPRRRPVKIPQLNLSSLAPRKDPLTELDTSNNIVCGPTENADSVMVAEYARKYHLIRKQNQVLSETIRTQAIEIDRLKEVVRTLQSSDADSSESRNDRTVSTNSSSHLPMVRVTPQKRSHNQFGRVTVGASSRSPRTARRQAARRLDMTGGTTPTPLNPVPIAQSTPSGRQDREMVPRELRPAHSEPRPRRTTADVQSLAHERESTFSRSRQILRNAGIESDVLLSSTTSAHTTSTERTPVQNLSHHSCDPVEVISPTPTPTNSRLRPNVNSRSISTSDVSASIAKEANLSSQYRQTSNTVAGIRLPETPIRERDPLNYGSNDTFVIATTPAAITPGSHAQPTTTPNPLVDYSWTTEQSPAYYLRRNRPEFIRRLERRQHVIRDASELRKDLERQRKDAFRAVATGRRSLDDVNSIIFVDPTTIRAFAPDDMKRVTRRRLSGTNEFRREVVEQEKKLDQAVNRIRALCFSERTKQKATSSRSQSVASHRRRRM